MVNVEIFWIGITYILDSTEFVCSTWSILVHVPKVVSDLFPLLLITMQCRAHLDDLLMLPVIAMKLALDTNLY